MTEVVGARRTTQTMRCFTYYLVAPAAGVSTVAITAGSNWFIMFCGALFFTGVDQVSPIDASANADQPIAASTFSANITTVANNAWIIDNVGVNPNTALTQGTGQTKPQSGNNSNNAWATSYKGPVSPAGVTAMNWTNAGNVQWDWGAISLTPAAGGTTVKQLAALGVG